MSGEFKKIFVFVLALFILYFFFVGIYLGLIEPYSVYGPELGQIICDEQVNSSGVELEFDGVKTHQGDVVGVKCKEKRLSSYDGIIVEVTS